VSKREITQADRVLVLADTALRAMTGSFVASRAAPAVSGNSGLSDAEKDLSGALMRVNHVGEVCAQALYSAQALATRNLPCESSSRKAAREETDHLAWTRERLRQLGARPSLLNPVWYAGAFGLGLLAGRAGMRSVWVRGRDGAPGGAAPSNAPGTAARGDASSRAVVEQMKRDEAGHAASAEAGRRDTHCPFQFVGPCG
jgi:ubiquinone biosynthesis monooxygenase Coq7